MSAVVISFAHVAGVAWAYVGPELLPPGISPLVVPAAMGLGALAGWRYERIVKRSGDS